MEIKFTPQFKSIAINTQDGFPLTASVFEPDEPNGKTIVFASAMGVLQQYYYNMAEFLRLKGFRSITFDYRGIGLSSPKTLKGFGAMLHHWGEQDIEAVLQYALNKYPNDELQFISHSVGGQVFGMAPSNKHVSKVLMAASQSGYWKLWPAAGKLRMFAISHVLMPSISHATGYFPAKKLGLFEDVPHGVATQWSRWIRNKEYMFSDGRDSLQHFGNVTAPMRLISFSDDTYAPPATVDWLATKYHNASVERVNYTPQDLNLKEIGHFAFFKRQFKPHFWDDVVDWFL